MVDSGSSGPTAGDTSRRTAIARDVVVQAAAGAVQVRWVAGRPVVLLTGDIDLVCAEQVRAVGRLLARWPHRACADAAGVTFIDVAGLRAVLFLAGPSRPVLLLQPSHPVLRLLGALHAGRTGLDVQPDPEIEGALLITAVHGW